MRKFIKLTRIAAIGAILAATYGTAGASNPDRIKIPDASKLIQMLKERRYEQLDRLMNKVQDAYEANKIAESALNYIVRTFHLADPEIGERLGEWSAKMPNSFAPDIASGSYNLAVAWVIRGTEYVLFTSDEQFDQMKEFLRKSNASYRSGLEKRPHTPIAWADLISVMMGIGGGRIPINLVYSQAMDVLPESPIIHERYHYALSPKWTGSKSAQRELRKKLSRQFPNDSRFNWAKFAEEDDKAWDKAFALVKKKRGGEAIALADRVVRRSGTYWNRLNRGHIYYNLKKYDEALNEYSQILQKWPGSVEPVKHTYGIMALQKRSLDVLKIWRQVMRRDPYNPEILLQYSSILGHFEMHKEANDALDRAFIYGADDDQVRAASGRRYLVKKQMTRAITEMQRAVNFVPKRASNWLSLARALEMNEDCAAIEPYKKVLSMCRPIDKASVVSRLKCKDIRPQEVENSLRNLTEACD